MNLAECVSRHAARQPDTVAIVDGERSSTYRDLDRAIRCGAADLRSSGIGAGDHVAICLKDTADHLIAFLAVARLGAAAIPIDWRALPAERARIARGFAAKLALIEPGGGALAGVPSLAIDARWHAEAARLGGAHEFPSDADAPLMIGLTSGTTGAVKGMVVTHRQMYSRALPFDTILSDRPHRYLSASPLAFSAGRNYCLTHIIKGHTVVFHPPLFTAEEYVETANRCEATAGFVVPTVIRWLLDLPAAEGPLLPRFEALMCGGAPIRADEKRATLKHITPNFYEFYGTVATGPISFLRPSEMAEHASSAGRPAALWDIEIVDEADRPLPIGSSGRLRVRGPALASGLYTGSASASAGDSEGFRDGWYYTGDLAALDEAGFLYLKGRATDVILRGGSNVYPDEIESVLAEHPAVAEAAAVGRPSPQLGEEIVAYVISRGPVEAGDLLAHCRQRLTSYKVPAEIVFVSALPRTNFGKVDRKRLAASLAGSGAP